MTITSTYSLLPLASSILVLTLGFFVWLKRPKEWLHLLFLLFCFTISIWLFGTFMLFNAQTAFEQVYWDRFIYIGVAFIPIFLYHFGVIYCRLDARRGLQHQVLFIGYLLAFAFLILSRTDYFVSGLYHYEWGVHTIARTGHHFFLLYFFTYFIWFFVNLFRRYRILKGVERQRVGYILVGFAILDVIGPFAYFPAYGIPVFPIIFLSGVPFALIVAYAIIRLNALDMRTIAVEMIVTLLNLLALAELVFAKSAIEFLARLIVLLSVFCFSILLVRSVKLEIERRKEIATLAKSLATANQRLQELDKQKTEFLSIASHQLRTPLSILKGYIELIHDGAYGRPSKKLLQTLTDMDQSNERLIHLVDEFLNISRIEQGRTKYSFAAVDLNALLTDVVKELIERAAAKGLKIIWQPNNRVKEVYLDEDKIRHVAFNFIDNAIKYSARGAITVTLEADKCEAVVKIKDQGIGFNAKKDGMNFFQKFYRGDNVKTLAVNGTGLGIFVCRKFIEAHFGRVWAVSRGLHKGSEFGFAIPLKQAGCSREVVESPTAAAA